MALLDAGLFVTAALIVGALLESLAARYRLPFNLLLLLAGFLASEAIVSLGFDTRLRWYHFHELVFYVLIPFLIFEMSSRLDRAALMREWRAILVIAGPALIVCAGVTAMLLYFAVDHRSGFPVMAALLAAVVLAAIDPGEVIEASRGDPRLTRSGILLKGESVFSDVVAVTLFTVFLNAALMNTASIDYLSTGRLFMWSACGGVVVGGLAGLIGRMICRLVRAGAVRALTAASIAFAAFIVSRYIVMGSGAVAVLVATLVTTSTRGWGNEAERATVDALGWSARVILFVLAGATVTTFMFRDQWLSMLIAIGAVTLSRLFVVTGGLTLMNTVKRGDEFSLGERAHMMAGGVRGAIVLALGLSLPLEFEAWYTVQSMVYGVVIFTFAIHPMMARGLIR